MLKKLLVEGIVDNVSTMSVFPSKNVVLDRMKLTIPSIVGLD